MQNHKPFPSISFWAIDFALQTIAVFLIALRGFIPDWLSIFVATSLVVVGVIAGYLGTAYFFQKKPKIRLNIFFLVIFLVIHGTFLFIYPSLAIRNVNIAFFFMLVNLECYVLMSPRHIDYTWFSSTAALRASYGQTDQCVAVAILDLDYFKQVNDTYGHFAGDATLIELTQIIQANIRSQDLLGRQGGEEFIIVAADTDKNDLKLMIERILAFVRDHPVHYKGFEIPYAFSGGVVDCRDFAMESISVEKLIIKADDRMYLAKARGRNQVIADD